MASEWDAFTNALKSAGIALNGGQDTLIWAGGDASGHLTVKNVYLALLHPLALAACSPRLHSIWNWPLPLKLQLFFWMCVQGKILTWEVLRKRGWHGPSRCALCKDAAEDLHHLFVHCAFSINIWTFLKQHFSLTTDWKGSSFTDCFISWTSASSAPHSLAAHVCWQTWKERNLAVFEDRPPSLQAVLHRILSTFQLQQKPIKFIQIKARDYSIAEGSTLICFDGAAHSNGLCCGAGGTFKSHPSRITNWFLNCGVGSNTKAELMGLWVSLTLASWWSLNHLLVLGDSRIVIDWINHICTLHSIHIEGWMQRTRELSTSFSDIKFQHFSRSFNSEADSLSKRALGSEIGRLSVFHCDDGQDSPISTINLFE
jgi:ribonuclease HI